MSVTIHDIAQALKIHSSTVSSCLAGNYRKRRISEKLAEQVRQKAAEMGYIPNQLAGRIFKRSKRKYLGLIFKRDTATLRTQPILDYAIKTLGERSDCDFSVIYAKPHGLEDALRNGIGLGIKDFIIIGYMDSADTAKINFSLLPDINLYVPDYQFSANDVLCPSVRIKMGFDRQTYYKKLIQELELAGWGPVTEVQSLDETQPEPEDPAALYLKVQETEDLFETGFRFGRKIEERFRAGLCRTVLFKNDSIAVGVMEYLLDRGIRIPEDIAIAGFNNSPFSAYAKIPLTTVEIPLRENIDRIIGHLLEEKPLPEKILILPQLIRRRSLPLK
ncbi:MAG: LacI family DNA-binding transcriptional regulator [Lentisphaeria bacterium]|nr:LacI family DNA-binding transcriptional regulator [Lentisphaeria bacterium]